VKSDASIASVVEDGLCLSCGTCVAVCPVDAIQMRETPGGLLEANIDNAKCTNCGICWRVCPGGHLEEGVFPVDEDPVRGPVLAAYTAKATNHEVLQNAQSGGLVTALLLHLIRQGKVEGALVSELPNDGSLRPRVGFARTPEEISLAQGSKYCPIALNEHLGKSLGDQLATPFALVGLPCHMHGLRNLQIALPKQAVNPYVTLGLFCDRVLAFTAMDYLIQRAGLRREGVSNFRYKDKVLGGWPGNIRIQLKDGSVRALSGDHRMECKDYFTPVRCRLCFDKLNVLADLSFGDAWGVQEDREGTSVIIVRSQRGMEVIASARDAGVIELRETDFDLIAKGQNAMTRFQDWSGYMKSWECKGRSLPDFSFKEMEKTESKLVNLKSYERNLSNSLRLLTAGSIHEVTRRAEFSILFQKCRTKLRPKRIVKAIKNRLIFLCGK